MIEFSGVDAGYGRQVKLHNIHCCFEQGNVIAILGPNGSGKSTLLKTILGMTAQRKGQILLDGKEIHTYPKLKLAQKIAFLPQNRNVPNITVERMILHGRFPYLTYSRNYSQTDYERVEQVLEAYQLTSLREHELYELSGGERQKVYLAMAQIQDSEYYLFDEPTTYLDISYQFEFMKHLLQLKKQGKTCLVVLHDLESALEFADKIMVLEQGCLMFYGERRELLEQKVLEQVFHVCVHVARDEDGGEWYHFLCRDEY